ncbi:MAG: CoA-binding protein [Dehalococcoidia bacterium]|nr:CoA-binding protein [Dehalococcoidia bacterium]
MDNKKFKELDAIFNPRSIAVIGASKDRGRAGSAYFLGILESGFKGKLYPVNNSCEEVFGVKAYCSLGDIPGPVDNVIVIVPKAGVLKVLDECGRKKVRLVQLFTAGYSEISGEEGKKEERQLAQKAGKWGFRLVGPNCVGVSRPAINLPLGPESILVAPGSAGFVSQSGSLSLRVAHLGDLSGVGFSKLVSFGNGCDLDSLDFLGYLLDDPETKTVSTYLEGSHDGTRLLELFKTGSRKKPIIVWKGGTTAAGARTASSHTGSMAGTADVWGTALKQAGVIQVNGLEEMVDLLLGFQVLGRLPGDRVTILSGFSNGGGGESVVAADVCTSAGLKVPPLTPETRRLLGDTLGVVGSILHNPVDVSQAHGDPERVNRAVELAAADPNIDVVIFEAVLDFLCSWLSPEKFKELFDRLINLKGKTNKPFVAVLPAGRLQRERDELVKRLLSAGIPVYPNLERAALMLKRMNWYQGFCNAGCVFSKSNLPGWSGIPS